MSISRQIYKEVVVHTHNGILLKYKNKHIQVSSNEVDETAAYYRVKLVRKRNTNTVYLKMVTMILYTGQQKTHRCKEQTFGLPQTLWEKARMG